MQNSNTFNRVKNSVNQVSKYKVTNKPGMCLLVKNKKLDWLFLGNETLLSDLDVNKLLPRQSECSYTNQDRIIGGTIANIDEFPWMALIGEEGK